MQTIYEIKGYALKNSQSDKVLFVCLIRDTDKNGADSGLFIRAWGRRGQGLQSKVEQGPFARMLTKCRKYKEEKLAEGYGTVEWTDPKYHIASTAVLLHSLIKDTWQNHYDHQQPKPNGPLPTDAAYLHSLTPQPQRFTGKPVSQVTGKAVVVTGAAPFDWDASGAGWIEVDEAPDKEGME